MPNGIDFNEIFPIENICLDKLYFITKIGTNDRIILKDEQQPLIIDNIDDAIMYAEKYTHIEQQDNFGLPYGYMPISIQDFMDKYGYS